MQQIQNISFNNSKLAMNWEENLQTLAINFQTRSNSKSVSEGSSVSSSDVETISNNLNEFEENNFEIVKPISQNQIKFNGKPKSVHFNFSLLKKKLNLEDFSRKTQIDSLLKKCKSKAFRTIHEALKKCLKVKLNRIPQEFITNIKIDFNKEFLDKTILEIYQKCEIITSLNDFVKNDYIIEDKKQIFTDFLNLTFKDVFSYYINSVQYVKDYNYIAKREGESFAILFNYISKIFIFYYEKSKGNKHKCDKEMFLSSNNNDIFTKSKQQNIISSNKSLNKVFEIKKMIINSVDDNALEL